MKKKILVAYATRVGSTADVAASIAKELSRAGETVDLRPIAEVHAVNGYRAAVIGSAVRAGRWLSEASAFVTRNRAALSRMPVAYFTVCLTLREDTPKNRKTVHDYLEPVRRELPAVDEGFFAGKMDYGKLAIGTRLFIRHVIRAPEGDFRNPGATRAWARDLGAKLRPNASRTNASERNQAQGGL